MRVDLRGGNGLMAKQFLHVAHIHAGIEEMGGAGVAEHVGRNAASEFGVFTGPGDQLANELGGCGSPAGIDEDVGVIGREACAVAEVVA